jgi:16S rRNA (guanine(1405)-N(7))-methyltransferase
MSSSTLRPAQNKKLMRMAEKILRSPKYHRYDIPIETVLDLLEQEADHFQNSRVLLKAVRQKLHNIMAPYLGDPDYLQAARQLEEAFQSNDPGRVQTVCEGILNSHASTRERIPILSEFYERIFAVTGKPQVILDLACGLHPFGFPWMGLPVDTAYHAYDLNRPRIELITTYFSLQGLPPLAEQKDVLLHPPEVQADVALWFKEAHRLEQRKHGSNLPLWQALNVHYLLVSLPLMSLSGKHDLGERQRKLVYETIQDQPWQMIEMKFDNELVFCINKQP